MKQVLASCVAVSFLVSGAAFAETAAPVAPMKMEKKVEQHKMEKKVEKKTEAPRKLTAQQEKMKTCNARAKGMKGEQRKAFMSSCLKKK
ncbi:PsiF family protein [Acidithiobacillus sp. AMEEHan]|uniref:PsiF family protein n=1 Tax=Acidithiobacillus sp. AMEEHan TaxID=2994951 RepID=UPI0035AFAA8F